MKNKHHRVLNGTQDEVIMKKWNLNWHYFTLKIGCFPSSIVQNLKPQSKFHKYGLCLHIIRIRIAYWRSMVCNGCRRDRFGVIMTFHALLKMAVWHPPKGEISEIYCTSYVHTARGGTSQPPAFSPCPPSQLSNTQGMVFTFSSNSIWEVMMDIGRLLYHIQVKQNSFAEAIAAKSWSSASMLF